jgi:hypothetical protein
MKAKCVAEISQALGRSIDRVEAQAIEQRMLTALRQDAKDRATWTQRTASERVLAAGARLASEAIGEARAARASLGPPPQRGRVFAQSARDASRDGWIAARIPRADTAPSAVYDALVAQGDLAGYIQVDGNGPQGQDFLTHAAGGIDRAGIEAALRQGAVQRSGSAGNPGNQPDFMGPLARRTGGEGGESLGQRGVDAPRGLTEIPEGGIFADPGVIVSLFEEADRSTPFHEFGHVFLETMKAYAARENAPAALTRDMDIVRRWLGAENGADFTTDQHERFARGFEAYLREGKAPSPGLEGAFEAFRRWLVGLYKSVLDLDVELDDDIRGVFDRLVKESDDAPGKPIAGGGERPAGGTGRAGDQRPGGGGRSQGADRGAGSAGANDPAATPATGRIPQPTLARDPELKQIAAALDEARAEIAALERQGLIAPEEAQAATADLDGIEKASARGELLRAAAFCLRHGARVTSGEP